MNIHQIRQIANELWSARALQKPMDPVTGAYPEITIEDAYQISKFNYDRKVAGGDDLPVGRKIGLTSKAVQAQLGVHEPDFGYLTSDMEVQHKGIIRSDSMIAPRAEGEVAFVLGKDLLGPVVTRERVEESVDYVVACIEVVDSRIKDWKIKIQDTVADNASAGRFVLGTWRRKLASIDLRAIGMSLRKNGEVVSTGSGAACLGHPTLAVLWLAQRMADLGDPLRAGSVILSGAYGPVVPIAPGDRIQVEISGLERVSMEVA